MDISNYYKERRFPPTEVFNGAIDRIYIFNGFYGQVKYQPNEQRENQSNLKSKNKNKDAKHQGYYLYCEKQEIIQDRL